MRHAPARLVRGVLCAHLLHTLVAEHRGGTDSTMKRAQPHPPHTRGAFHRRLQPLYTEKHKVSCSGFLPNTSPMQHSCNHYNALCSNTYRSMQPLHYDLHPLVAEHRGTDSAPKRPQPHPPHTGGTFHFARKNTRFCAPASILPNTSLMQHSCSHYNALCSNTYTSMQPLHYDLHPLVAEHRGGTDSSPKRPQPHPPHTGGTFHRRLQPLYTEKHKVSCSASSPTQVPCNIHVTITMRFAATPTHPCSHYTTICIHSPMQHSCSQYNAFSITMRFAATPTHP